MKFSIAFLVAISGSVALAQGFPDVIGRGGRPRTKTKTVIVEKIVTNVVERIVEKPVTAVEKVFVDRVVTNTVEKIVEKVVEKPVPDDAAKEKYLAEKRRADMLEAKNTDLREMVENLKRVIAADRERMAKLERVVPKSALKPTGRPAKITAASTYYDRKEGIAVFDKNVVVDDEQYKMHADKVYVFMQGTNDIRRIVAMGNVAMTNEARRAYGAKVSYYRDSGMVVLYSGDGITAEVRDESKIEDQSVKGEKIKFWINSEQVEVLKAQIQAPTQGMGAKDLKKALEK